VKVQPTDEETPLGGDPLEEAAPAKTVRKGRCSLIISWTLHLLVSVWLTLIVTLLITCLGARDRKRKKNADESDSSEGGKKAKKAKVDAPQTKAKPKTPAATSATTPADAEPTDVEDQADSDPVDVRISGSDFRKYFENR